MRKRLIGVLTALLCMILCMTSALAVGEEVRVTVTASETELAEAGNVTFTFNISNFSDYELSDIVIVYNGTSHTELQETVVPPNQSIQDYKLELPVSDAQLGNPIVFTISGVRNGEPITAEASVTITRSSDPVITLTREADATMVRQGESVKLTYSLKNETKFDMTDIQVIDQEISDIPQKLASLRAGGTMSWDWSLKMAEDDALSAPTVTYTVNGKTKSFSGVEPLTLTALLVKLDMQVNAGTPTAAGVSFTIDVKNTGNQEIKDITIADERGNTVTGAPFTLKAGESGSYTYLVVPVMSEASREVKFTLNGTDSMAQPYTLTTPESYPVYPFVDETQINVTMITETVTPWTSDTGKVVARVVIRNQSAVALTGISILETGNVLKTYDTLQSGETSFDTEVILGSPRNLQFTLKGTDPTGMARELATSALPVAYGTEDANASPSPDQISTGGNMQAFSFLSSTISKILVALGILMVLSFVVLIALSIAERSRTGGLRYDEEDDEEDDLDDFFRGEDHSQRAYYDDHEEVSTYTQRIQNTGMRRTTEQRMPPISLPPATPQQVAVEYEPAPTVQPVQPPPPDTYWQPAQETPQSQTYWQPAPPAQPVQPAKTVRPVQQQSTLYPAQSQQVQQSPVRTQYPQQSAPIQASMPGENAYSRQSFAAPSYYPKETPTGPSYPEALESYAEEEELPFVDKHMLHTPKVIANKRKPAVLPKRRNEIRHVYKDPQK